MKVSGIPSGFNPSSLFPRPAYLLLVLFLVIPSMAMLERFLEVIFPEWEWPAVRAIQLLYLLVVWLGLGKSVRWLAGFSDRSLRQAVLLIFVLLGVSFAAIYPMADSGRLGFVSDRDEALDIAVDQLAQGHYPYYCRVLPGVHSGCPETGNAIAPLPGSLILNLP
ncbi:MAG: hypothetical protein R3350_09660, partial [Saprospiraceae bacterium]|nr:hypothetical protein [Saprospiraceae bacterium]